MEIMKNINGRMPMNVNPAMKMVSMKKEEAPNNNENPLDSSNFSKNKDNVDSGRILYCQYCILPANSGGFVIN